MKISTITNAAYGITVALTALAGTAFILSNRMASEERQAVEIRMALEDLGAQVETDAELRTDEARLFVMRADAPAPAARAPAPARTLRSGPRCNYAVMNDPELDEAANK